MSLWVEADVEGKLVSLLFVSRVGGSIIFLSTAKASSWITCVSVMISVSLNFIILLLYQPEYYSSSKNFIIQDTNAIVFTTKDVSFNDLYIEVQELKDKILHIDNPKGISYNICEDLEYGSYCTKTAPTEEVIKLILRTLGLKLKFKEAIPEMYYLEKEPFILLYNDIDN